MLDTGVSKEPQAIGRFVGFLEHNSQLGPEFRVGTSAPGSPVIQPHSSRRSSKLVDGIPGLVCSGYLPTEPDDGEREELRPFDEISWRHADQ